ncbi:MAG TPA: GNAT family N-acetyltransferase [Pyrinomonadaceae bacterium]|nr:GNAT family N-acetyltransferase [Pyrinomonadaceae bacterium]
MQSINVLDIRVYRDIDEIDAAEWDALLGPEDLLMSHRFIRACQQARIENAEFWHLVIKKDDAVVGIATLHRIIVNLELLSNGLTRKLVRVMKSVWPNFFRLPVLFCGLPISSAQPCLKISSEVDFNHAFGAVIEVMERIAASTSTRLLCFKEFTPEESEQMDFALSRGYFRAFSLPSCSIALPFDSFFSYLASMKSSYRRQVQSTLRARRETGLRVRHLDAADAQVETIFALYSQTIRRAQQRLETLNAEFFRLLDICLRNQAKVVLIELDGRPLAMAVMLFAGNVATFLFAGMEDERKPEWQLYQNLLLDVVASAIDAGATRLELGQTSYAMKSRMGAEESPRYLYLRYRGAVKHSLLRRFSSVLFPKYEYPRRRVFARS